MASVKLIFLLLCIFAMTLAFPQLAFPHLPDEEGAHPDEENQQSSDDWFENLRYSRQVPYKDLNPHPPHHPHIGDVHPENIRPQMIGSDQIEYEKSDSPREIRRFARQVMLIPKELAKEMEKVEDDRSTAYVPPDLFSSNQEIKKVFKRDQVVVESSLYEKGHEPQARVEKEKSV